MTDGMSISQGDRLPEATFLRIGEEGPEEVRLTDITSGRRVVVNGMPGAFTRTCSAAHLPSLIRTAPALRDKGIDAIVVVVVNDPFVADAWAEKSGAKAAGIEVLADPSGTYVKEIGMAFDAPPSGFYGRSVRHAMVVNDGVVEVLQVEEKRGTCELTSGETLLAAI